MISFSTKVALFPRAHGESAGRRRRKKVSDEYDEVYFISIILFEWFNTSLCAEQREI